MLPSLSFLDQRWFTWSEVTSLFAKRNELRRSGVYVVADFPNGAPVEVTLPDPHVVYVGETHGRTANLSQRLGQFASSAGFLPSGQQNGHYAAWRVATLRGREVLRGQQIPPAGFFFAICPYPAPTPWPADRPDAPGVFPTLVESLLLWQHTLEFGRLPVLNNSGRQVTDADVAARDAFVAAPRDTDILALLDSSTEASPARDAAVRIAGAIAKAYGYGPAECRPWSDDGVETVYRHMGAGVYLYVGRSSGSGAFVSVYKDHEVCRFGLGRAEDEGAVSSVPAFRELLGKLWDRWV